LKALIVGDLTLDLVEERKLRVGGPGYYGGWALKLLEVEVYLLTSMSSEYRRYFNEVYAEFNIYENPCGSIPIFAIVGGRATRVLRRGCSIPADLFKKVYREIEPEILIFSPVLGEVKNEVLASAHAYRLAEVLSLDIQGLVREVRNDSIANKWSPTILDLFGYVDIIHGNVREFTIKRGLNELLGILEDYSSHRNKLFLVSMDEKGLYMVYRGCSKYIPPVRVKAIDEVGAGDVLLAVTSYYKARGYNEYDATMKGVLAASLKVAAKSKKWFNKKVLDSLDPSRIKGSS